MMLWLTGWHSIHWATPAGVHEFFIYSGYNSFLNCIICQYFLPVHGLSSYSVNWCLSKNKNFNFDKIQFINIKKIFYLFLFLERGEREKERKRNIYGGEKHPSVASRMPPAGNLTHNPGMCPDWELNWQLSVPDQCSIHWPTSAKAINIFFMD